MVVTIALETDEAQDAAYEATSQSTVTSCLAPMDRGTLRPHGRGRPGSSQAGTRCIHGTKALVVRALHRATVPDVFHVH